MKPLRLAIFVAGSLLLGTSIYFAIADGERIPRLYIESRAASVTHATPRKAGACENRFNIESLELTPVVIAPTEVSVNDSFLIGVRYEITDATIERFGPVEPEPNSDACEVVASVAWREASSDERRTAREEPLSVTLALAGAEVSPTGIVLLMADSAPKFWSVRPLAAGNFKGWISLSTELLVQTDTNRSIFSVRVTESEGDVICSR